MLLTDLLLHIKGVVPIQDCKTFIDFCERRKITSVYEESLDSNLGITRQSSFKVVEIPPDNNNFILASQYLNYGLQKYIDHTDSFKSFNTHLLKNRLLYPHKIRILKYSQGASIHPHTDIDCFEHASITINLNDGYEGGIFSFFNRKYDINLGIGDMLIFPANAFWVHEVTTITQGTRYSINSFISPVTHKVYKKFKTIENEIPPIFKYE